MNLDDCLDCNLWETNDGNSAEDARQMRRITLVMQNSAVGNRFGNCRFSLEIQSPGTRFCCSRTAGAQANTCLESAALPCPNPALRECAQWPETPARRLFRVCRRRLLKLEDRCVCACTCRNRCAS